MLIPKDLDRIVQAIERQTRAIERVGKAMERSNEIAVDIARYGLDVKNDSEHHPPVR